jgi:tetratricopeptide (TPR) repeat protein
MSIARWSSALLTAAFAVCAAAQTYAPQDFEGPSGKYAAAQLIAVGLYTNLVDRAEKQSTEALDRRARMADGTWEIAGMYDSLGVVFRTNGDWDRALKALQRWRTLFPESRTASVAEARYWIAYAGYARGGEWASQVPSKAWEMYYERLKKAREVLENGKAPGNPHWHTLMLDVAYALDRPADEKRALFEQAVREEPYYYSHYFNVARYLAPRWSGSLPAFHSFVEASVKRTRERDGATMYARLYWVLAATEFDREPFTDLGIPWTKMREGFEELMRQYPKSQWNLNNYAYFACRAKDRKTFGQLVGKIDKPIDDAWNGAYTLDYCKELLLRRA